MIAIVDYRAGNLTSVRLAFDALGAPVTVTRDPAVVRQAERVVFPGVGAAGAAMAALGELGLAPVLREVVARGTPFLGICLGTQIICDHSDEDGGVPCVGLVPGRVVRFRPARPQDNIPPMGWDAVQQVRPHPLFAGIPDDSEFYFVHSYYPAPTDPAWVAGATDYAGVTFASALGRANLFAVQFHPERSGRLGLRLLDNFRHWTGSC